MLEPPFGLTGKALPHGVVQLSWQQVPASVDYQLYRQGPGESELTPYRRTGAVEQLIDTPATDGAYTYAIASVRQENRQEAVSGMSTPVTVTSDSIPPGVPRNLSLMLIPQGINAVWQAPAEDPGGRITYQLYRADANEIVTIEGLTPIIKGVKETTVLDPHPSVADHCYVVAAVDAAGNVSAPSNSFYLNYGLLPVSSLKVTVTGSIPPLIQRVRRSSSVGYRFRVCRRAASTSAMGRLPMERSIAASEMVARLSVITTESVSKPD
jgi:hypothetical protein